VSLPLYARFAPPFIVDNAEIDMIAERLGDAIDAAVRT